MGCHLCTAKRNKIANHNYDSRGIIHDLVSDAVAGGFQIKPHALVLSNARNYMKWNMLYYYLRNIYLNSVFLQQISNV